ncbi:hypothetical protein LTR85_001611 [Meristemomyces frigidus]|nr:hypothetical protein LTR85_001611 [Meristemomyces frigidus]
MSILRIASRQFARFEDRVVMAKRKIKERKKKHYKRPAVKTRRVANLLTLPGELRNRIYRLALVAHDDITVDKENWKQPALLQVCKRIRKEGSSIYYEENKFGFDATDFNSDALISWFQHGKRFPKSIEQGSCGPTGRNDWGNLLRWLKRCFEVRMFGISAADWSSSEIKTAVTAFKLADNLRLVRLGWEQVHIALELYRQGLKDAGQVWE